ncbi:MAG: hypothetical protein PVJ09_04335 [Candidatus Woesebacteria bacterium]
MKKFLVSIPAVLFFLTAVFLLDPLCIDAQVDDIDCDLYPLACAPSPTPEGTTDRSDDTWTCNVTVKQSRKYDDDRYLETCYAPGCMQQDVNTTIRVTDIRNQDGQSFSERWPRVRLKIKFDKGRDVGQKVICQNAVSGDTMDDCTITNLDGNRDGSNRQYVFKIQHNNNDQTICGPYNFLVSKECEKDVQCNGEPTPLGTSDTSPFKLCAQINDAGQRSKCESCAQITEGHAAGIWTAVGCIPTKADSIIMVIIKIGLGLAGGLALLIILISAFMLSTSQGEPKRVGDARDRLTSAVIGLIFIIFSVTILQFIGVKIFNIPGFAD